MFSVTHEASVEYVRDGRRRIRRGGGRACRGWGEDAFCWDEALAGECG